MHISQMATALRVLCADIIEHAKSGHPGLPLGMADVVTVLFKNILVFNPIDPTWTNRDRFVLSAGHGSALLYALLYLNGYERPTLDDLKQFRKLHSVTPGHPELGLLPGIETTTGPLGQGLANAVGMAIAQKIYQRIDPNFNYNVYVLVSDGDLMEGIAQESISLAGHHQLSNLTILFDNNKITIDGPTSLTRSENIEDRFWSSGFDVIDIDGHNPSQIKDAFEQTSSKPKLISAKTIIGFGAPNKQGSHHIHGSPLGAAETLEMRKCLNWPHPPFQTPDNILLKWRQCHSNRYCFRNSPQIFIKDNPSVFKSISSNFHVTKPALSTRKLFHHVLEGIVPHYPLLVGGSADLTPSNNTKASLHEDFPMGNYIHYGIREHAMAGIMNGLSLSGFIPYGGTFLVFSDYLRPALRMSCLMKQGVIYVFTHDSIGVGEDGSTHQPIEHLSSLRALPNLLVFRPCDAIEVVECVEIALQTRNSPSALILTRQNLPFLRDRQSGNLSLKGGYVLKENLDAKLTLIATGSEVSLAIEVEEQLSFPVRIVSLPCIELFEEQSKEYQASVLGHQKRIGIEAGCDSGWHKILKDDGLFFGLKTFGASGPYREVYDHFGLSAKKISKALLGYASESYPLNR